MVRVGIIVIIIINIIIITASSIISIRIFIITCRFFTIRSKACVEDVSSEALCLRESNN